MDSLYEKRKANIEAIKIQKQKEKEEKRVQIVNRIIGSVITCKQSIIEYYLKGDDSFSIVLDTCTALYLTERTLQCRVKKSVKTFLKTQCGVSSSIHFGTSPVKGVKHDSMNIIFKPKSDPKCVIC